MMMIVIVAVVVVRILCRCHVVFPEVVNYTSCDTIETALYVPIFKS